MSSNSREYESVTIDRTHDALILQGLDPAGRVQAIRLSYTSARNLAPKLAQELWVCAATSGTKRHNIAVSENFENLCPVCDDSESVLGTAVASDPTKRMCVSCQIVWSIAGGYYVCTDCGEYGQEDWARTHAREYGRCTECLGWGGEMHAGVETGHACPECGGTGIGVTDPEEEISLRLTLRVRPVDGAPTQPREFVSKAFAENILHILTKVQVLMHTEEMEPYPLSTLAGTTRSTSIYVGRVVRSEAERR